MEVEEFKVSERGERRRGRGRQPRLSLGPPPLSKASQRGCLSPEELEEWSKRFSLPDRELRACERAVGQCFRPLPLLGLSRLKMRGEGRGNRDTPIGNRGNRNRNNSTPATPLNASVIQKYPLSLSKWVRWQTGQTHFKMVGPSAKGKQFVSLLEFMDLMYSCEGLGESYDSEMAAFLDRDDIHEDGGATSDDVRSAGSGVERERRGRKGRRRRMLPSNSSDDDDFRDEGVGKGPTAEKSSKITSAEEDIELIAPKISSPLSDQQNQDHLPGSDGRDLPPASQHVIPRPPSCDSLDWLDTIEPTQVSTPLPLSSSSTSLRPPPPDFQFAFPHTPPSSRKGKTSFVTPLTTPRHKKPRSTEHHPPPASGANTTGAIDPPSELMESLDLFSDIPSAVLFDDFSDVGTSQLAQGEREDEEPAEEPKDRETQHYDPNITSIPESEDEGEEMEGSGVAPGGVSGDAHCNADRGNGDVSEDSLIGGCGQKRRKFARPDFLLTQAPPKTPPTYLESSAAAGSSDDEDFLEPLSRRVRRRRGLEEREPLTTTAAVAGKRVCVESEDFLEREAELSGEGSGGEDEREEVEGERDEYDMEDSFINDNSVLTQVPGDKHFFFFVSLFLPVPLQVTPSQLPKEKLRSKKLSPANMADVYRQSLMSPQDTVFGGRRRGRGNGYRMVLSQRHHILNHYLGEAGGKKRLFHGEGRRREGRGGESGEESEAEEVRVCYGEEDEKEMEESQSIGEPWDWGEEESDETRADQLRLRNEDDVVSPSLLVSQ